VYREITGEDANAAFARFYPYMKGQAGFSREALSPCLRDAGWLMTPYEDTVRKLIELDGTLSSAFRTFWAQFQGAAAVCYSKDDSKLGHWIVVRSGGVVLDPEPSAPENGEFIVDYFKQVPVKSIITSISLVARM
jgi:hypothetical protein